MAVDATLEELAKRATDGDRSALEALIRGIQHRVYGLAVRMLGDVEDARDATQEIILRLVTRLSSFRGEGTFMAWALRVAASQLINLKAGRREMISFEAMEGLLDEGLRHFDGLERPSVFDAAVVEEGKLVCTQGMLLCLDREQRLAFILGEVLELPGSEAAAILNVDEAAYRKRLSRARQRIEEFAQRKCGIVNPSNSCRCNKQAAFGVKAGAIDAERRPLSTHPRVTGLSARVEQLRTLAAVLRTQPEYAAPEVFLERVRAALDAGTL
jgi:RNA polymerase sigma factor (sigma-70 family)